MTVRCKFTVVSTTKSLSWDKKTWSYTVKLTPVTGDSSPENKQFWEFTPSGNFEFTTINEEAALSLKIGKDYYVDFNEAP